MDESQPKCPVCDTTYRIAPSGEVGWMTCLDCEIKFRVDKDDR